MTRGRFGSEDFDAFLNRIPALSRRALRNILTSRKLVEGLRKLTGPLQLRSEYLDDHITVDVDETAREVYSNMRYVMQYQMPAAAAVLILAYEMSLGRPWHDKSPLWEFLRHCRHAAAHGGSFNLKKFCEPKRAARWGAFAITPEMEGVPLFRARRSLAYFLRAIRSVCCGTSSRRSPR